MSKEPEDPLNPWGDMSQSSSKKKKSDKAEENKVINPWTTGGDSERFHQKKKQKTSTDSFDKIFDHLKKTSQNFKNDNKTSFKYGGGNGNGSGGAFEFNFKAFVLVGAVILLTWLSSGVFRVQETDLAVILRLGKIHTIVGPGLRYHWPYPFENVIVANVSSNNVMSSTERFGSQDVERADQTLVLTGDENIIHISYTVTWKIKDLSHYLFAMRSPNKTILFATESIIREVIGQTDALSALTEERSAISQKASLMLQKLLDSYNIGVQVVQVQLQKVEPPEEVVSAFNDMQASLTDGDGLRIKAEAYKSEIVPKTRGDAAKIIQEAEGYAQQVVARAQGEVDRFNAVYQEYRKNPEVASKRLYIDALESILANTNKTIVDYKAAPGIVPYVNLQPTTDKK